MNTLGVSALYHDSAACLVRDGLIVAAAQEERFTRVKHDATFPRNAIRYCLEEGGLPGRTWVWAPSTRSRSCASSGCWRPIWPMPHLACSSLWRRYLNGCGRSCG